MFSGIRDIFLKGAASGSLKFLQHMKNLLRLYVKKRYLLDLTIAFIFLPLFCHLIVSLHSRRTITELLVMKAYWIPMGISYACGLAVMAYIRWNNRLLEKNYGVDAGWEQRAAHQLRWNVIPPLLFVVLIMAGYFAYFGTSIFARGYLRADLFIVLGGIFLLVMLYYVQNEQRYLWLKQQEQEEFDRLTTDSAAAAATDEGIPDEEGEEGGEGGDSGDRENGGDGDRGGREDGEGDLEGEGSPSGGDRPAEVTIRVVSPGDRRKAHSLPLSAVAVIDRHGGKTRVSTWDRQLYEWPMPAMEMKALTEAHGFTWLGQHYALRPGSAEDCEGVGSKGIRLLLRQGITVAREKQVLRMRREGEPRTYLLFHKNIARDVREWFDGGEGLW
jgi:Cobalamin biosynthesis protein CobT (nicotinate-mononucleotide:5, 6-dimethylbenzimidazole phosphoribosyltransferase)